MNKLNLGCGKNIKEGWINVDCVSGPGVDIVWKWGAGQHFRHPFIIQEVYCSHVLEHITNPLEAMEELYGICGANAKAVFRTPYGSSDNAWEDPTHVRPYFVRSFAYFSQMMYFGADYGYRGDWEVEEVKLLIPESKHKKDTTEMMADIDTKRNIVIEMITTMRCIKPIRVVGDKASDGTFRLVIEAVEG